MRNDRKKKGGFPSVPVTGYRQLIWTNTI